MERIDQNKQEGFDAIRFMHEQRDKIRKNGSGLTKEGIISYCKEKSSKERVVH